ncbi:hypothetical protein A3J20_01560 [Candidatus Gottesmanbacteria bacterium RIFCSPLOWO2_02_FULL_42_29]|uniref:Isocitrate/homoisocitrate dehydrogenase n=2 Tax=Candidatus Gottesmaniibacteriota TaxID=1752720 RepID=A0A1F6BFC2_9BACT|nr:MAG: Homoisocitrate dehydrogenase [Candidatus Gottesmanbacteria bacterium GW2011_GWA2_42_18]OGG12077.1 MAG: hypothetical protein A2781_03340 [Candidatus Gottesmanbacteria bacterium RIFCSPHIGHO2_01_FULL_42_27]OGG35076.1 MAG: hypothetical protein A3G68_01365 [Candidatus Gottesmanbacteria bacterium RIFCSPLOWO2_12_FULL_42_10]OGG35462.1 MAG: hypothetical protein A2968_00695 [Candidatus Gottesmanbacteria bacterium RIFCSPLOWO2_01_FULL_42_22]OGG38770.1 MAG: hypothetical protein A3J20_01560 [Candidat
MYSLCVIRGDGVGPEVISETLLLLEGTSLKFNISEAYAGYQCYLDNGSSLPEDTVKKCEKSDAILFGAVTTPPIIENYFSPIVRLRKILDLYANVRPFYSLPLKSSRQNIDFVIVRENTEDLYAGKERKTKIGAEATRIITKKASEKIIRFAFELAIKQNRKKVTVVHKANILRLTDGLFLKIAEEVHSEFPEIEMDYMLVDSCALNLVKKPDIFDIIVTTNMFGDILSDEAAALIGGLGVAASANIGESHALFEPVHGSAPKYQGKNVINPVAAFFAACLMLEYLGEFKKALSLKKAIIQTIKNNCVTFDLGGNAKTSEVTREVIINYKKIYDHN